MPPVCVNCGLQVTDREGRQVCQLYDQALLAKTKILKLLECRGCGQVCDRYLEVDGTLVLLDLALQSQPAYRHLLLNQKHTGTILRLSLVTLIVDGYCRWSDSNTGGKFFEQEFEFYLSCGEALTSLAIFLLTSLAILLVKPSSSLATLLPGASRDTALITLLSGLLLAYCTSFLKLVALLWVTPDTTFLWSFVDLFFLVTSVSILQVLTPQSGASSWATMLSSHSVMHLHSWLMPFILEPTLACS